MEATVSYLLMLKKYINSKQDSEIKEQALSLGKVSKDFTINNMIKRKKKKIERNRKTFFC